MCACVCVWRGEGEEKHDEIGVRVLYVIRTQGYHCTGCKFVSDVSIKQPSCLSTFPHDTVVSRFQKFRRIYSQYRFRKYVKCRNRIQGPQVAGWTLFLLLYHLVLVPLSSYNIKIRNFYPAHYFPTQSVRIKPSMEDI